MISREAEIHSKLSDYGLERSMKSRWKRERQRNCESKRNAYSSYEERKAGREPLNSKSEAGRRRPPGLKAILESSVISETWGKTTEYFILPLSTHSIWNPDFEICENIL